MKNLHMLLALLVLAIALPFGASAQYNPDDPNVNAGLKAEKASREPEEPFRNVLKLHPFGFVGSHLMLGYERRLNEKWALNLNAAYGLAETNDYYWVSDMEAFYLEAQPRFYISGVAEKLYVSPYALFKTMSFRDYNLSGQAGGISRQASAFGVGVLLGYHFRLAGPLMLDGYMGGGLLRANVPEDESYVNYGYYNHSLNDVVIDRYHTGIALQLGLAFGIDLQ